MHYLFSITGRRNDLPTLEDMKVAVLKAGLANQEYRKKQEMRLIFNMGLCFLVDF